jgi:RNA polymerase sigma-70 factor (ECF subfamily)
MRVSSSTNTAAAIADWSDEELVRALAGDDEKAFAEIYERYWQLLHQQAVRKLGHPEDAEEVVQDLFVTLWNKRRIADIQQLKAYLLSALKYKVIDCVRAQLVRKNYAAGGSGPFHTPNRCTEETVAATDLTRALDASLRNLPEHSREVFRLSRQEHQSVPEIAARLRVSPKTVEYHLSRSLRLLRAYLKDFLVVGLALLQLVMQS